MDYKTLLENAPAQDSDAFIEYLRQHNPVVFENDQWIVIENAKRVGWLTAFWKTSKTHDWYDDIDVLWYQHDWASREWRKHATKDQTVPGRFHIHILPE